MISNLKCCKLVIFAIMKRTILTLTTTCMAALLAAQEVPGSLATRQANDASGKMLTMEETILSRELAPARLAASWINNEYLRIIQDGKLVSYRISDGDTSELKMIGKGLRAYTDGQSLRLRLADGTSVPVAESENPQITYGQHVSRNEFGINGGIFISPDSSKVAFFRKDESKVNTFPLLDITTRTGTSKEIKYPMAGMDSENVQLGVYDVTTGQTVYMKVDEFGYDQYLTNISWRPDESQVLIQVLDRSQKHMKLNVYDAVTGDFIRTILTEDNEKYVEPLDPVYFLKGSNDIFIYRTDNRDGYRNLYLCDFNGNVQRITSVDADVAYVANDGKYIWYTSAEVSPVENHLFRISVKKSGKGWKFGKPEQLTQESGWHDIAMSPDCRHFVDTWSNISTPHISDLCTADGKTVRNLKTAEDPTLEYAYTEITLGTVKSADGKFDNYYRLIKPKDFDPTKKYPVILYVYGGPHSQMVRNTYLAELRRW